MSASSLCQIFTFPFSFNTSHFYNDYTAGYKIKLLPLELDKLKTNKTNYFFLQNIFLQCFLSYRLARACLLSCGNHVWLYATPWTIAHQALLSMKIVQASILEWIAKGCYQPRIKPASRISPALAGWSLPLAPPGKSIFQTGTNINSSKGRNQSINFCYPSPWSPTSICYWVHVLFILHLTSSSCLHSALHFCNSFLIYSPLSSLSPSYTLDIAVTIPATKFCITYVSSIFKLITCPPTWFQCDFHIPCLKHVIPPQTYLCLAVLSKPTFTVHADIFLVVLQK